MTTIACSNFTAGGKVRRCSTLRSGRRCADGVPPSTGYARPCAKQCSEVPQRARRETLMDALHTRSKVTLDDMSARIGTDFGVSDWITIDQAMIDQFAKLTHDEYFIHVDPVRAASETPHGGTIAHGFLTLSLLAQMGYQVCPMIEGTKSGVNYGFNKLRFVAPVRSGKRVRGHFRLRNFDVQPARWTTTWDVTIEIEGSDKPAIVAEWLGAGFL
jgi:acyl dehydratase